MFKINHKDTRTMTGIFIVSFEDTSHFVLMLLLFYLSKYFGDWVYFVIPTQVQSSALRFLLPDP